MKMQSQQQNTNHDIFYSQQIELQWLIESDGNVENTKWNVEELSRSSDSEFCSTMPATDTERTRNHPASAFNTNDVHPAITNRSNNNNNNNNIANKSEDGDTWIDVLFKNNDKITPGEVADVNVSSNTRPNTRPGTIAYASTEISDEEMSLLSDVSQSILDEKQSASVESSQPTRRRSLPEQQQQHLLAAQFEKTSHHGNPPSTRCNPNTTRFSSEEQGRHGRCSHPSHSRQQHEGSFELEFTTYTTNSVKNCDEPMLLTLTSFPFRVIYANQAGQEMIATRGGINFSSRHIIGKSIYEIFDFDKERKPICWGYNKDSMECGYHHFIWSFPSGR